MQELNDSQLNKFNKKAFCQYLKVKGDGDVSLSHCGSGIQTVNESEPLYPFRSVSLLKGAQSLISFMLDTENASLQSISSYLRYILCLLLFG